MDWETFNETKALADMPTDLSTTYQTWLSANPTKSARLAELCAGVVAEFRDAIHTTPANTLDPDESTIPSSTLRHAETILFNSLKNEMGETLTTADLAAAVRADMSLRQIAYGHFSTGVDSGENRRRTTPAYFTANPGTSRLRPVSTNSGRTVTTRIVIPKNKRLVVGDDGSISVEDA